MRASLSSKSTLLARSTVMHRAPLLTAARVRDALPPYALGLRALSDRWIPALAFAAVAGARGANLVDVVRRSPGAADSAALIVHVLAVVESTLALLFCSLISTLFMRRYAPRGRRAGMAEIGVALAGTFLMNGVLTQSVVDPDWRTLVLANALLIVGLAISIHSAASLGPCFGLAAEARGLVTTGTYQRVRHPLYLGELIAALGILLPVLTPLTVLLFSAFCVCQIARAVLEERALAATFPEYTAYRHRTPALIPLMRPRLPFAPHDQELLAEIGVPLGRTIALQARDARGRRRPRTVPRRPRARPGKSPSSSPANRSWDTSATVAL